jgi:hypothetical protein
VSNSQLILQMAVIGAVIGAVAESFSPWPKGYYAAITIGTVMGVVMTIAFIVIKALIAA